MTVTLFGMLFVPAVAALLLLAGRGFLSQNASRRFALAASIVTLLLSLLFASDFLKLANDAPRMSPVEPRFSVAYHWFEYVAASPDATTGPALKFNFLFGADGISLTLILLTTLLTVSGVLISWESIRDRAAGFYACLLLLEAGLVGVFTSFDLVLFYVFFEFTLVPLFFLIVGRRGGTDVDVGVVALDRGASDCRSSAGAPVPGDFGRLHGEGARVPTAHMVAARTRGSADGG